MSDCSEDGRLEDSATAAVLRAVYGICALEKGLSACLPVVQLCVSLIDNETSVEVAPLISISPLVDNILVSAEAVETARLLSFICFSPDGAKLAVQAHAVESLMKMLRHIASISESVQRSQSVDNKKKISLDGTALGSQLQRSNLAAVSALAACTGSDDAKMRILPCEGSIDALCSLLGSADLPTKIAALKVVSNIAVHPETRHALRHHPLCLRGIRAMRADGGGLMDRHARVAEEAVLWEA